MGVLCAGRWTNNGPDGGSRLLKWDGSHEYDANGNKVKCRGQFVGGRVLCDEKQKADAGHRAWEASQVTIPPLRLAGHIPNTARSLKSRSLGVIVVTTYAHLGATQCWE